MLTCVKIIQCNYIYQRVGRHSICRDGTNMPISVKMFVNFEVYGPFEEEDDISTSFMKNVLLLYIMHTLPTDLIGLQFLLSIKHRILSYECCLVL